jgi:hypothetical protein
MLLLSVNANAILSLGSALLELDELMLFADA